MQVNKGPLVVQGYHYDLVEPTTAAKTDIQVQIQEYQDDAAAENSDAGQMVQILIPFDIHPEQAPFEISGLLGQVIQLVDFDGEIKDLSGDIVEQLSQPLIEQIQIITYQVTALTLDHGYQLDFQAEFGDGELQ
ncbi:DUF1149 family protein [Bombilactobacillus folatiphilus]|uniref:DUF1149 family protein n=1 Tax=Bombilactobacillus folatiphilus TaxID=2923362 RepID=A0ABY4P7P0_9LACO|nr:DUF1149 family protein [Bombilactobacillus folatiphilus]UQS81723.1 DUF1149 family protein [Bombilactobacillus folatiphilus]